MVQAPLARPVNETAFAAPAERRATAAARAELFASEYGLKTVQLSLVTEVVATYYQLLDFHQRLAISEYTLQSRQKSLDIIQQRFDKGIISELDLNQAQIQKEIAAAAIPLYQRSITKTENVLSVLLGRLPESIATGIDLNRQTLPPDIPTGLPSSLLERRPDVIEALYLVKAQTENIGIAEALRFPAISLTGTLGIARTDVGGLVSRGGYWSLGGSLLGPIYDFDKNIRRVDIEKALNANMLSNERYDKGYSNYLEVLETERSLFNVELQYSELKQQYLNSYVNLYKALGGGWITKTEAESKNR